MLELEALGGPRPCQAGFYASWLLQVVGMFPLILADLDRDYHEGYYNSY